MAPREGWSWDRCWSSASSIKALLKTRFFLSIIFNVPFSFSSVFCEYLLDSDPSQQQFICRDLCLFIGKADSSENQDLKEQKDDLVGIAGLQNPLGLTLTSVHIHSLERHFRCGPYPGKAAQPAPAGAPQVRIWPGLIYLWTKC